MMIKKTNDIDIVIVNYCSTFDAIQCLRSIQNIKNGINANIVVVDNHSDDQPEQIINHYPDVRLIRNKANLGFGRAVNNALTHCRAPYFIVLNPDTILLKGFFDKILHHIKLLPKVGVVGPKIYENKGDIQASARRFPSPLTSILGRKSPLTRLFPNNRFTKKEFVNINNNVNKPEFVDWVSGACMVVRKDAYDSIGGFDERFFLYWEDADLCKRLKRKGWKTVYYPEAQIYHRTGKSSSKKPVFSTIQFHKSSYLYFLKHANWPMNLMMPIAFLGLSLRCLVVIALNGIQRIRNGKMVSVSHNAHGKAEKTIINKKIKVLRIVSRLNVGGPSLHCAILLEGLNNDRFTSRLISGSLSPHEGDMRYLIGNKSDLVLSIPELQREISPKKDWKAFVKIFKVIRDEKPDIVHTHMAKAGAIARMAVFIHNIINNKKIRTVHTFHGHVLDGYFSPLKSRIFVLVEKWLARFTDAIIAISQTQKWELSEKYKLASPSKIHTINLGFDLERFTRQDKKGILRAKLGINNGTILVGIVGRLVPIKNHVLFLQAAKILKYNYKHKSIRFVVVGDGELRGQLEDYAREIGLNNDVVFFGWAREVEKIYADLDCLVLTSDNEGTPVSIIEAMASSVPVVTTGVGGVKDLLGRIENGKMKKDDFNVCERGILCPKGNPEAIANGVARLIEGNTSSLKTRARNYVLEHYSNIKLIQRIETLYSALIARAG